MHTLKKKSRKIPLLCKSYHNRWLYMYQLFQRKRKLSEKKNNIRQLSCRWCLLPAVPVPPKQAQNSLVDQGRAQKFSTWSLWFLKLWRALPRTDSYRFILVVDNLSLANSLVCRTQVVPKQNAKIIPRTNGDQGESVRGQFRSFYLISFRKDIAKHVIYLTFMEYCFLCWFEATLTSYRSLTSIPKISPNQ